ncbi:MAG TPA: leucyl aminopeptidase, partial [Gammaproteobacteria bacterium]|nr:leucyl aminopeptidase [Gammaproteobacteria bacterium]
MKINLTSADPTSLKTDCLVVGILDDGKLTASAKKADKSMGGIIQRLVDDGDIKGNSGSILMIPCHPNRPARRLLAVGLGKAHESGVAEYKRAVDSAASALANLPIRNATVTLAETAVADRDVSERLRLLASAV